ncbi:MAG: hypothetical protein SH809_16045 [Rhodothermales bacterium]|nr:hypothetical protein [Rhodothermales bacterium]
MKRFLISACTGCLLFGTTMGCNETQQPPQAATESIAASNPLVGAWEFVSSRIVLPDTIVNVETIANQKGLYLASNSHWAFVSSTSDGSKLLFAGRGTYTIEGNSYKESVQFHTFSEVIGSTIEFEFDIKGDTLTKAGYLPVWDAIRPIVGELTQVRYEEVRVRAKEQTM